MTTTAQQTCKEDPSSVNDTICSSTESHQLLINLSPNDGGPTRPELSDFDKSQRSYWLGPPNNPAYHNHAKREIGRNFSESAFYKDLMAMPSLDARWEAACLLSSMSVVPIYSETGYTIVKLPKYVHKEMLDFLEEKMKTAGGAKPDKYVNYGIKNIGDGTWKHANGIIYREPFAPLYTTQPYEQASRVLEAILPLAEEFAGTPLKVKAHHGIRVYTRNNQMYFHTDRIFSHAIGANIHIKHHFDDDEPSWPFEIYNHATGEIDRIEVEEGDVVLYEAVGNMHARPEPLKGNFYASVFFHFVPVSGWPYNVPDTLRVAAEYDLKQTKVDVSSGDNNQYEWHSAGTGQLFRVKK